MSNSEYMKWMNAVQSVVRVRLSPSHEEYANARAEYEALTGTTDTYEHNDIWNNTIDKYGKLWVLENISLLDAQKFAEPIRIANPNECVSLYTNDKSFIGNTSWADQMKYFFEYETFTPEGTALAKARQAEAKQLGIIASWE